MITEEEKTLLRAEIEELINEALERDREKAAELCDDLDDEDGVAAMRLGFIRIVEFCGFELARAIFRLASLPLGPTGSAMAKETIRLTKTILGLAGATG